MRIAQVTAVFPPYKGGIGQVAYHYARELTRIGELVTVLTPDYGEGSGNFSFEVKYLRPWFKWGRAGFCPQVFRKLLLFDVVQLHYPAFGLAEIVWLAKLFFPKRFTLVVFYHHDVVDSGILGLFFAWYTKHFLPRLIRVADKVLVSSFDYADHSDVTPWKQIYSYKFDEIPFGVTERFVPANKQQDILETYSIDADSKIILFVGGLDRNHYFKGADKLIKACHDLTFDNWHLLLVGGGDLVPELKSLVYARGLDHKITFAGFVGDDRLPQFYQTADVFVLPSTDRSEAFGIVLVEAMACGVPVIASNLPGVRSVLIHGETGLLTPPKDIDRLREAIGRILTDENLRLRLGKAARARALKLYQWQVIGEQLLKIYNQC